MAGIGIQGLSWQRLRRFGVWGVWHTVDAHNRTLCGLAVTGTKQTATTPWSANALPTGAGPNDMCLPCSKVKVDIPRQTPRKR